MLTSELPTDHTISSIPENKRPNPLTINHLRDDIPKVGDTTAQQVMGVFQNFLETFKFDDEPVYAQQIQKLRENDLTTVYVDYEHIFAHDEVLAQFIVSSYYRMEPYLKKAVQTVVGKLDPDYLVIRAGEYGSEEIKRDFWVSIFNFSSIKRLREIKSELIGQLTALTGTVTRTSEVRPELCYGTFQCVECLSVIKDVEQQFKYTEPKSCSNQMCNNKAFFNLLVDKSNFSDWQKIRIQENAQEIPSGAMPRSMDVILRNEMVERVKAGDRVTIIGTPIVVPDITQFFNDPVIQRESKGGRTQEGYGGGITGLKSLGVRELTYKLIFLASFARYEQNKTALNALHDMFNEGDENRITEQFTDAELRELEKMREDRHLYHKLVSSIAPHIFGHEDIKKGLLLHLLGGVHKQTGDKTNLRGDINVCIVGDPSTAKSQFLKYVSNLMPRAIYTSGKASSAAGLTASVVKDEDIDQFTIEAGALMLADNGICCIDEFDKMDVVDQVAIHEAMEQQTITITKAGISATLNARTSILAAANPIRGRYDRKLSLRQNINMSAPILSRFDLFFVILDDGNEAVDYNIAKHIVNFHRFLDEGVQPDFSTEQVLRYLQYARALKPMLSVEARELLTEKYRQLRQEDSAVRNAFRLTVRQLESMIRLSEALAKLHFSDIVEPHHVMEAYNLLKTSIVTIDTDSVEFDEDETPGAGENMLEDSMDVNNDEMEVDDTQKSKKMFMESDEYHALTQQIIFKISQHESLQGSKGMRRSEVLEWHLEKIEEQLESAEDIAKQTRMLKSVIKRMVEKDGALLILKNLDEEEDDDPLLTVSLSGV